MSQNNPFGNTDWINNENTLELTPPVIQWRRGDLVSRDPLLKGGCWQLPVEQFEAVVGDKLPVVEVLHSGGKVVPSYLLGTLNVLLLAWRKSWIKIVDDQVQYLAGYEEGAKGKLQCWVLAKELGLEPALLTASGLNSKYLNEAIQAFRQRVIAPASQIAKRGFGYHHFYLPLSTQGKITTTQNQYVTPPGLGIVEINREVIISLFAGQEAGLVAEGFVAEAKRWGKKLMIAQPPEEVIEPAAVAGFEPAVVVLDEEEIPF